MFPLTYEGSLSLSLSDSADANSVLSSIESGLPAYEATSIRREGATISFRGGVRRLVMWSNKPLRPVGRAQIQVLPSTPAIVKFRFSFLEAQLLSAVVFAAMTVALIRWGAGPFELFFVWPLMLCVVVIGNYLIARVRLRALVQKVVGVPTRPLA